MTTSISKMKMLFLAAAFAFVLSAGVSSALDVCTPCGPAPVVTYPVVCATPAPTTVVTERPFYSVTNTYSPYVARTTYSTVGHVNYVVPTTNGWVETAYRPIVLGDNVQYYTAPRYSNIQVVEVARR